MICLRLRPQAHASMPPLWLSLEHCRVTSPPISASDPPPWALSSASAVLLVTIFDSIWNTIFDLITLNFGFDLIRFYCSFNLVRLNDSRLTYLLLTEIIKFDSNSSQASESPTLARVSPKYSNTEIVEYSTILIIEIVFGENTLPKFEKTREVRREI